MKIADFKPGDLLDNGSEVVFEVLDGSFARRAGFLNGDVIPCVNCRTKELDFFYNDDDCDSFKLVGSSFRLHKPV